MLPSGAVNPHYLDRLVAAADAQHVHATEGIVTGTGVKLLTHKLSRPLEQCVGVSGVTPTLIAKALVQQMLATLKGSLPTGA